MKLRNLARICPRARFWLPTGAQVHTIRGGMSGANRKGGAMVRVDLRGWLFLLLGMLAVAPKQCWAQAAPAVEADPEVARQQQIVSRFLAVLERNPRRGTALDKIYGFHIENG